MLRLLDLLLYITCYTPVMYLVGQSVCSVDSVAVIGTAVTAAVSAESVDGKYKCHSCCQCGL